MRPRELRPRPRSPPGIRPDASRTSKGDDASAYWSGGGGVWGGGNPPQCWAEEQVAVPFFAVYWVWCHRETILFISFPVAAQNPNGENSCCQGLEGGDFCVSADNSKNTTRPLTARKVLRDRRRRPLLVGAAPSELPAGSASGVAGLVERMRNQPGEPGGSVLAASRRSAFQCVRFADTFLS